MFGDYCTTIKKIDSVKRIRWFGIDRQAKFNGTWANDIKEIEEISSKDDSTGTYSLEYLNPIVKAVGAATGTIICEFSSAKPLRIEFKVANMGRIHFYLAPRVES